MDGEARILTVADAIATQINSTVATVSGNVSSATNATPIVITTATAHGLVSGVGVTNADILGNTGANGTFVVTVIDSTSFSLTGSVGNGAYSGGGTWTSARFVAETSFKEYKAADLTVLRVDVRFDPKAKPEMGIEEESQGGAKELYRVAVMVQKNMSAQALATASGTVMMRNLINLSKRIARLYKPSDTISSTALVVGNELTLYDDFLLVDKGIFRSTLNLTMQEYTDD